LIRKPPKQVGGAHKTLAESLGIPCQSLNLDYYSFEVKGGRVRNGICLYYTESKNRVKASKHVWYTENLNPINPTKPTTPAYLKLRMGGRNWYKKSPTHH